MQRDYIINTFKQQKIMTQMKTFFVIDMSYYSIVRRFDSESTARDFAEKLNKKKDIASICGVFVSDGVSFVEI